jgi:hypothetical protein
VPIPSSGSRPRSSSSRAGTSATNPIGWAIRRSFGRGPTTGPEPDTPGLRLRPSGPWNTWAPRRMTTRRPARRCR